MPTIEEQLSEIYLSRHFVSFGYGRNGIIALLKSLGLKENAEIIIPAFTCESIPVAIRSAGFVPIAVDSEAHSPNPAAEEIKKRISEKTAAVYIVHTYGIPANIEAIAEIAKSRHIFLIEDIAHALLTAYRGRLLGDWGDFTLVSFTKQMINSGGAAIGIRDEKIYKEVLRKRDALHSAGEPFSLWTLTYKVFRFINSCWESRGSTLCMLFLKLVQEVKDLIWGENKTLSGVPGNGYRIGPLEERLACRGLKRLQKDKETICSEYERFRLRHADLLKFPENSGVSNITYWTACAASPRRKSIKVRACEFLSFKTWPCYHPPGEYPQADDLFKNIRIFSRFARFL